MLFFCTVVNKGQIRMSRFSECIKENDMEDMHSGNVRASEKETLEMFREEGN